MPFKQVNGGTPLQTQLMHKVDICYPGEHALLLPRERGLLLSEYLVPICKVLVGRAF